MRKKSRFSPIYFSVLIFILSEALTLLIAAQENSFLESNEISIPPQETPETSLVPILVYFFGVVIVMGLILYLVPARILRVILRTIFAVLFSWGIFIALIFFTPLALALTVAVAIGLAWLLTPKIWLHNAVMILTMVSLGAVFGRVFSPWTAMIVMLILSVYDYLAVRFGYMLWLAKRLSQSTTLPAFIIPRNSAEWGVDLKNSEVGGVVEEEPSERDYSVLGGGDIGFPLLLVSSVYFAYGLLNSLVVALFALLGLLTAYWIQARFLKGRPIPALPPITTLSFIGFLLVFFTQNG